MNFIASPHKDKYKGVLLCPQCGHDYPDLANYKLKPDQNDPLAQNKGSNRFVKFKCVKCKTMLKKILPRWVMYFLVLSVVPICIFFVYMLSYFLGNEPLGFGINQFYVRQYLDYHFFDVLILLPVVVLLSPYLIIERRCQRLEIYDQNHRMATVRHSVFIAVIVMSFMSVFFLGYGLSVIKVRANSPTKPEYQNKITTVLKFSPILRGPFYVMQGQGNLLNADFEAAIKNYDLGIETIKDHSYPYLYRGIAHLYSKNYDQAEADLSKAIQINTGKWEPDDKYKQIWVYLAKERKNGSGKEYLEAFQDDLKPGQWPDSLLLLLLGKTDPLELEKAFRNENKAKQCKIAFYAGIYLQMKGQKEKARIEFEKAKQTKTSHCFELHAAGFELGENIDHRTAKVPSNKEAL